MESELLLAPITALEIVGDHLVAGEGPNIVICLLESEASQSVRYCKQVLRNSNVHGIKEQQSCAIGREKGPSILAVFGGKSLVGVELGFRGSHVDVAEFFPLCEVHDWIWDLQWLEGSPETLCCVALALGHNSVALYDCVGQKVLREVHCQERCILYSAHLVGSRWDALVVVAGTVFNQLVVWHAADPADGTGRVRPRSRIRGHSGVIFSICYSESKGVLASASDDRSLRLWGIGDLRAPSEDVPCLLVCYGHQSRVWSVKLLNDYLVSIGEDSACLVWNYQGEVVRKFKSHKGRGLRAVAVHEGRGWVFAGGADGGIRRWALKGESTHGSSLLQLNFPSPQRKGAPRAVKLVDGNRLLVMTDAGAVYTYDTSLKAWEMVLEDAAYQSYSLLDVCALGGNVTVCAMGNLSGHIKVFPLGSPWQSQELQLFQGKVHSLTWSLPSPGRNPRTCSLLVSGPAGALLWLEVSCAPPRGVTVGIKRRFLLPLCKQRWHTCAALLPQGELLLCGDRRGSVMLFACRPALPSDKTSGGGELGRSDAERTCGSPGPPFPMGGEEPSAEGPVSLLFGLHGKLGVTSVLCHGGFIYSTGRDGCYRQLQAQGEQLRVLRKQKPCKGLDWLEELRFGPDGSMWVLGFRGTHFMVWSTDSNETLLSLPCGGGHRSWSYTRRPSGDLFAYIKSGDVMMYQRSDAPSGKPILKEPLHSRELTCVCYLGTLRTPSLEPVSILATGSEDNAVNILAFRTGSHSMARLTALSDHISSVRALAVAEGRAPQAEKGCLSPLLFSAGGRAQIEGYRLLLSPTPSPGSGVACRLAHVASHRLDEHWERMKNRHKYIKMDPETRYMSIAVLASTEDAEPSETLFFLAAACSDGSVRLFLLLESSQKLTLVAESFYHQHCVLKVQAFASETAGGRRRHFVASAATDGSIAFWDVSATLDLAAQAVQAGGGERKILDVGTRLLTIQAHSCGVNSLQVHKMAGGHFLVASGSDDGSISVSDIDVNDESIVDGEAPAEIGIRIFRTLSRPCAHAAHVTGVRLLRPDLLLSASVDQRLTLWHLCEDRLSFVCSKFCHVADVAALECWEVEGSSYHNVVCGQGLQVLHCSLELQGTKTDGDV
uniref:tRNA (34-2'-O)-methyltransferase regulator WDR6 n=1 Tax=Pogona vitticeps TaxID=103695 RepID=A0ABM5FJ65_9SAUR